MERKTSTVPTRIYSYGCLPPTVGAELLEQQLRLGNDYWNTLVNIERWRRERITEAQCAVIPGFQALVDQERSLRQALDDARKAVRAKRASARKRKDVDTDAEATVVRTVKGRLREVWEQMQRLKLPFKKDGSVLLEKYAEAAQQAYTEKQVAYNASPLYWGTKLALEKASESWCESPAPPDPRRYEGEGRLVVQLQNGFPAANLPIGTFVQVDPVLADTYERTRHARRLASRTRARIRVGTVEGTRTPIWVELPVIMHRPLPQDGRIMWAWVLRRRVGPHFDYQLQFALESAPFRTPEACPGSGAVVVNLGWRRLLDEARRWTGELRVAYWLDDQGRHEQLLVPNYLPRKRTKENSGLGTQKVEDLQAFRDEHLDEIRSVLTAWLSAKGDLPEWLRERTEFVARWRAPRKFAGLLSTWLKQRIPGDEGIIEQLQEWNKRDKHLYAWQAHQQQRRIAHRREVYRRFAVALAKRYARVIVETTDLRVFAKMPEEDEEALPGDEREQRYWAKVAAPGELREYIRQACRKYGAALEEDNPENATQTCFICGVVEKRAARPSVMITCAACGETWDQDENNCQVRMIRASGAALRGGGGALAEGKPAGSQAKLPEASATA